MRSFLLLLLLFALLGRLRCSTSECLVDEAISKKIRQEGVTSSRTVENIELNCRTITSRGNLATCPSGYAVTGCACGFGCGSWDVRAEATCHCQCPGMDWTAARCCAVQVSRI